MLIISKGAHLRKSAGNLHCAVVRGTVNYDAEIEQCKSGSTFKESLLPKYPKKKTISRKNPPSSNAKRKGQKKEPRKKYDDNFHPRKMNSSNHLMF